MRDDFEEKFLTFFEGCKRITELYRLKMNFSEENMGTFRFTKGKRYWKVILRTGVHAFVDTTNGDVLKPASWATPAKHARGNIFDDQNGLGKMTPYGPEYLK